MEAVRHLKCGQVTPEGQADKDGAGALFCVACGKHYPQDGYVSADTGKDLQDA